MSVFNGLVVNLIDIVDFWLLFLWFFYKGRCVDWLSVLDNLLWMGTCHELKSRAKFNVFDELG